jgi:hypothetical protein
MVVVWSQVHWRLIIISKYSLARLIHSFTWKSPFGETSENMEMGELFGPATSKAI